MPVTVIGEYGNDGSVWYRLVQQAKSLCNEFNGRNCGAGTVCGLLVPDVLDLGERKADFKCRIRAKSGVRAPDNSSVILASDVLAGVIGHERGCDKADHRANRNVCGDRK